MDSDDSSDVEVILPLSERLGLHYAQQSKRKPGDIPFTCKDVPLGHKDITSVHKDIPSVHKGATEVHKDIPLGHKDITSVHKDIPSTNKDVPLVPNQISTRASIDSIDKSSPLRPRKVPWP